MTNIHRTMNKTRQSSNCPVGCLEREVYGHSEAKELIGCVNVVDITLHQNQYKTFLYNICRSPKARVKHYTFKQAIWPIFFPRTDYSSNYLFFRAQQGKCQCAYFVYLWNMFAYTSFVMLLVAIPSTHSTEIQAPGARTIKYRHSRSMHCGAKRYYM